MTESSNINLLTHLKICDFQLQIQLINRKMIGSRRFKNCRVIPSICIIRLNKFDIFSGAYLVGYQGWAEVCSEMQRVDQASEEKRRGGTDWRHRWRTFRSRNSWSSRILRTKDLSNYWLNITEIELSMKWWDGNRELSQGLETTIEKKQ